MKRLTFTICICTIFLSAVISQTKELQTSKEELQTPKFILGGSFAISNQSSNIESTITPPSITFTNSDETKTFNFNFNPYFAKQINSSDLIGFELQYTRFSRERETQNSVSETIDNGFGVGIFYRKYFDVWNSFRFFVQPYANFVHRVGKIEQNAPALINTKGNTFTTGISLNISYTLNKWSLFANLIDVNYTRNNSRNALQDSIVRSNRLSFNTAFTNLRFGIERRF